uniref:Uncharacterized protein n=1 Tax=Rhizophora mucronata TaxID=61149 RepID=A0A2P2N3D9_RHIMU
MYAYDLTAAYSNYTRCTVIICI